MKKLIYPAIVVTLLSCLFSCSTIHPRYINNPAAYSPSFFRHKGDLKLSGAFAFNPDNWGSDTSSNGVHRKNLGFDGQAAVAVTDHFMIQAGGMYRTEKDVYNNDDITATNSGMKINYTRSMFDIGAGFYTAMGGSGKVYFNSVLGAGFGSSRSTDIGVPVERNRNYDFDFIKYHFTPSFNFFFTDNVRLSVAPRVSLMTANNIKTNYTEEEQLRLNYNTFGKKGKVFFEPSLLFQGGPSNVPWLKFDLGAHFATNPLASSSNENNPPTVYESGKLRSRRFLLSLGLSFYPFEKRGR
ncbi:hypothetical protein [Niabella sp.]|uniref:hypothetical protein n=1 Tax=Niabella sp. TaxID=1962976 RepID=UPI00262EBBC4|nr:hypothetical protein [Niabella sp.]